MRRRRWCRCADCGRYARHEGRGLCGRCVYRRERDTARIAPVRVLRYVPRPGASPIWLLPGRPCEPRAVAVGQETTEDGS